MGGVRALWSSLNTDTSYKSPTKLISAREEGESSQIDLVSQALK